MKEGSTKERTSRRATVHSTKGRAPTSRKEEPERGERRSKVSKKNETAEIGVRVRTRLESDERGSPEHDKRRDREGEHVCRRNNSQQHVSYEPLLPEAVGDV